MGRPPCRWSDPTRRSAKSNGSQQACGALEQSLLLSRSARQHLSTSCAIRTFRSQDWSLTHTSSSLEAAVVSYKASSSPVQRPPSLAPHLPSTFPSSRISKSTFQSCLLTKPPSTPYTVASTNFPTGAIAPSTYRKFALREKTELSQGIYRFVFDLPTSASVLGLPIGQHVAIRGSVEDTSVTRSYTPVSNNRDLGRLELLIRIYPDGQLGQYLKALQPGDKVDIRGPKGAMRYRKGMSKELGMVGGGTGITPLFQLIRAICEDKTDTTKISLVYANRSEADIMLRDRLDTFAEASNGQFTV